jgi:hypothetical protein
MEVAARKEKSCHLAASVSSTWTFTSTRYCRERQTVPDILILIYPRSTVDASDALSPSIALILHRCFVYRSKMTSKSLLWKQSRTAATVLSLFAVLSPNNTQRSTTYAPFRPGSHPKSRKRIPFLWPVSHRRVKILLSSTVVIMRHLSAPNLYNRLSTSKKESSAKVARVKNILEASCLI